VPANDVRLEGNFESFARSLRTIVGPQYEQSPIF
jgi:hypothetical protein